MNAETNHTRIFAINSARRAERFARGFFHFAGLLSLLAPGFLAAQTAIDEESPWPRVRSTNGNTVTIYLPQVERWTTNWFSARAVVEVKPAGAKKESLGVVWFEAHGTVDRSNRVVTLDRFEITKGRFPDATDDGSNALTIVREVVPDGARTVSLDYLITALGFEQAAARQGPQGLSHTPPDIRWETNRAVLILIDGDPVLHPVPGAALERVINTPALLVRDQTSNRFYLAGDGQWFTADSIQGPWSLVQVPPAAVAALSPAPTNGPPTRAGEPAPRIIVSTRPAELLMTDGFPYYKTVRGTSLQAVGNSDSLLFYYTRGHEVYLLLSGRWFQASSLRGPWNYIAPHDLPEDFAKIPPTSPQGIVLASVPDTPQAELAMVADSAPTTATVDRHNTKIELTYDGEPQFKPIEGTAMSYAVNAQLPVIHSGESYYALDKGVWFVATSPGGPWEVATEVPEEIYTIPPSSPVYYATFARVYDADTNSVEVGYTAGYTGAYEDDGTMVYGTGYDYQPWYSTTTYYGWGWTWGYGYAYVPWYGWWTWRPWWSGRGALRAAIVDNIYHRWQSGVVTPYDRSTRAGAIASQWQGYSGYPAVYGRFQGATRPTAMTLPANTLALNPYSRPKTPVQAGETPHGAQLLSSVRQSPGGGRDLYASPDGNIYQRRTDGWYRNQASGKWSFYAPLQGTVERGQAASARGATAAGAAQAYRANTGSGAAAGRNQTRSDRVPNAGSQANARDVAALERQYYSRALNNMRTQNVRPAQNAVRNTARPARGGGGRLR